MTKQPIIDMHCDLLMYLHLNAKYTPYDSISRCSIPQLQEGGVRTQVMAIFSETFSGSTLQGMGQARIFQQLPKNYSEFQIVSSPQDVDQLDSKQIGILPAIENASVFFEEMEPLEVGFARFSHFIDHIGSPLYISMTWNYENRFGGGNRTSTGLKHDGHLLLDFLHEKGIAIDLSHTSDALASGILNHIDRKLLNIPVMASHSNFRAVTPTPRNLSDEIAKEIIKRNGFIGFNAVRPFISNDAEPHFEAHLAHALKLGGENHVGFGADFFYDDAITTHYNVPLFFDDYGNSSVYPRILEKLGAEPAIQKKVCYDNALRFWKQAL